MNKSHKELLPLLEKARGEIKKSDTVQDMCEEYGVDVSIIDLIPMCFADLEISAKTDKGVIYLNYKLVDDFLEKHLHYCVHEATHHLQQTLGDGPTKTPTKDNYLDCKEEKEGFQAQTEYLSETRDDKAAIKYIDKVLDYHDIPDPSKERKERREELLQLAQQLTQLIS